MLLSISVLSKYTNMHDTLVLWRYCGYFNTSCREQRRMIGWCFHPMTDMLAWCICVHCHSLGQWSLPSTEYQHGTASADLQVYLSSYAPSISCQNRRPFASPQQSKIAPHLPPVSDTAAHTPNMCQGLSVPLEHHGSEEVWARIQSNNSMTCFEIQCRSLH